MNSELKLKLTDLPLIEINKELDRRGIDISSIKKGGLHYPVVWKGNNNKVGKIGYKSYLDCIYETSNKIFNQM